MMSSPQSIEGRVSIDLHREGNRLSAVHIASTRPVGLARAFAGRSPAEVLSLIPLVFTLCGVAHSVAAVEAYEDAAGLAVPPATTAARRLAILAETAREHMLRIALDWPRFLGETAAKEPLPRIMALLPAVRRAVSGAGDPFLPGATAAVDAQALSAAIAVIMELAESVVFGEPVEAWLARASEGDLAQWAGGAAVAARFVRHIVERGWQALGAGETHFLPELNREELAAKLGASDCHIFLAAPVWRSLAHETTPLARQRQTPLISALIGKHGSGLLARAAARLVELAQIPGDMRALADISISATREPKPVNHDGLAQVEAARGRLVHYLRLGDGRVAHYAILAPTEWNFHPHGAAAAALQTLHAEDTQELCAKAEILINVIDPCVAHELRLQGPQVAKR